MIEEYKVSGLVVRSLDHNDNDKLLTILTNEKGKITVLGKGVKSLKSKHLSTTQLFAYANYVIKKKGDYYYISDSDLIESFFGIREDIFKTALAQYFCDIASDLSLEDLADTDLLRLTLNTLYVLSQKESQHSFNKIKAAYELKSSSIAGFQPNLDCCDKCGISYGNIFHLDVMNGIVLCENCFKTKNDLDYYQEGISQIYLTLNKEILNSARYIINSQVNKFLSFSLSQKYEKDFAIITEKYLLNHLEHDFNTLKFYKSLFFMEM